MDNLIVLPNHFNGNDTIIYSRWVKNGCQFFHIDDARTILDKHRVPEDVWQQVLDAEPNGVTTSGSLVWFALRYCRDVSNDTDMRQVIIDSCNAIMASLYCHWISNDPDMRQVVIDSGDAAAARWYCQEVSNDPDMRAIAEK